jgi:hypothetical protein
MKQPDLIRLLRDAHVPDRPDGYWDLFPGRVIGRLQTEGEPPAGYRPWRLGAALAAAACGLALGFVLWHRAPPPSDASLRDGRVLRELLTRYPGRLQAVIQDQGGLHTQLSNHADVSPSDPIWLEILDGKGHQTIVTFSGQRIRCGDTDVIVLSDGGGQIILVGDAFFWSRQVSAGGAEKVRIRAEQFPKAQAHPKPPVPL